MADQVDVRVTFEMIHPDHGTYRDALYYSIDEYASLTKDGLSTAKQERFDNWVNVLDTPPPTPDPVEPTTALDDAQGVLEELAASINEIAAKTQAAISSAKQAVVDTKAAVAAEVANVGLDVVKG